MAHVGGTQKKCHNYPCNYQFMSNFMSSEMTNRCMKLKLSNVLWRTFISEHEFSQYCDIHRETSKLCKY